MLFAPRRGTQVRFVVAVFKLGWSLVFFKAERRYNDAHKSTRSIVERIIGILKKRWACLKELRFKPGKCCEVIVVCCILHNFCGDLLLHDDDDDDDNEDDDDHDYHEQTDETVEGREYRVEFIQSYFS